MYRQKLNCTTQVVNDVNLWLPQGESGFLAMGWFLFWPFLISITWRHPGVLNCIRIYGGYNKSNDPATLFDVDGFDEKNYVDQIHETSGNVALAMNWYGVFWFGEMMWLNWVSGTILSKLGVFSSSRARAEVDLGCKFVLCWSYRRSCRSWIYHLSNT